MGERFILDGQPVEFATGDSIAVALVRSGQHPRRGTLCLEGDCGSCVCEVDDVPYVRTCLTPARPGVVVRRHPAVGAPALIGARDPLAAAVAIRAGYRHAETVTIGGPAADLERHEVIGVFPGPTVVARTSVGITHVHAERVVIDAGSAELHPVCPGNDLIGILTRRAADHLISTGVDLGRTFEVTAMPQRIVGENGRVIGVVAADGTEHACDTLIVSLGGAPRDVLARIAADDSRVTVTGAATEPYALPPAPVGRHRVSMLGHDRGRSTGRVGPWLHRYRTAETSEPVRHRNLPGRRLRSAPPGVRGRPVRRPCRWVHRPASDEPGHDGRSRRRGASRPVAAHLAAR